MSTQKKAGTRREEPNMKSGARILVESLERLGVKIIFGYPGGACLPLYDALTDCGIKVILSGDERCAGHSAQGYARATGKVGVCLVTSGPGSTNLVTPLADARMDSTPIVAISGQVASGNIGKDAFQEVAFQSITMAITKHNYLVTRAEDIGRVVNEAFYVAKSGRPGPVVIDFAKDAQAKKIDARQVSWDFELRGYHPERRMNVAQIDRAMETIGKARKPMLYIGQGIVLAEAWDVLREFVEKTGIPVATTLLSAGAFPASHELNAGPLGMHGAAHTNFAIHEADVVVALGARFDDRVTGNPKEFAKQAQFIHVDLDPSEINKNVTVQIPVAADVKEALTAMASRAKDGHLGEWRGRIAELKRKYPMSYKPGTGEIKPQYVVEKLSDMTSGRAVVTTGVGQHQMWTWQYYKFEKPRHFITSGGAGTMGFGLPAAIGAQFARPGALVIDVDGDGSFEMNINDMRTVADNNLPIKVVILNNHMLGMVGQWQRQFFKGKYSSSEFSQDFPNFTAGCKDLYGIPGKRIKRREEVVPALEEMLRSKEPYILDCQIPKEENVYPMIPAGGTVKDMILGEDQGETPPV